MHRFFIDPKEVHGQRATLTDQEARHASRVLRLAAGDQLTLLDGRGMIYRAEITSISTKAEETLILERQEVKPRPPFLHLGLGLLKGNKMDFVIQKATELGVDTISPFTSQHCANLAREADKAERWQRIALEACKQCGRPLPPTIEPQRDFAGLLDAAASSGQPLLLWEKEQHANLADLAPSLDKSRELMLFIGPEGGFSDQEIDRARAAGVSTVSLGSRILRAETAAVAGMAIVQFLLGNLDREEA